MSQTHRIRLRGPWQATVLQRTSFVEYEPSQTTPADGSPELQPGAETEWVRQLLPSDWQDWLGDRFRGKVRYRRRFGLPTGLSESEQVWLVVEDVDLLATVRLNDVELGTAELGQPARFEITQPLATSNWLEVDVSLPERLSPEQTQLRERSNRVAGGLIGLVALEIVS